MPRSRSACSSSPPSPRPRPRPPPLLSQGGSSGSGSNTTLGWFEHLFARGPVYVGKSTDIGSEEDCANECLVESACSVWTYCPLTATSGWVGGWVGGWVRAGGRAGNASSA